MDWHLFFAVFWVNYWLVFAGLGIVILFFSWLSGVLAKKTSRPEVDLSEPRDIFYLGMGITSIFNMFFAVFMSGWDAFLVVALWLLLGYVLVVAEAKRFVSWREAGKRVFFFLFLDFHEIADSYKLRWHLAHGGTEEEFFAVQKQKKEAPKPMTWKVLLVAFLVSVAFAVLVGIAIQAFM